MVLPLLRVCGTVQQNPHMRALVSGSDSTVEQKEKYRPQVLAKCVCTPGTERLALGMLLERFGLVNVHCGVMSFEAFWVAIAITAPWNYALICLFTGCAGATFRDQSVLVLADVCPERCGHSHRHCSRLGQSWRWRDPDLYDVGTFQSYGGFRNGAEYCLACLDGGASGDVRDLCHLHEAHVLGYAYGTQPRSIRDRQYTKALDVGLCRRAAGCSRCGHDGPIFCVC